MRQGTLTSSIINQVSMRDLLIPVYVSFICGGGGGGGVEYGMPLVLLFGNYRYLQIFEDISNSFTDILNSITDICK